MSESSDRTDRLVLLGSALLFGVAAFRATVLISPFPEFDLDPLQHGLPWLGIGPTGTLIGTALVFLASTLILLGERRAGRGVDHLLMLLALIPLVGVLHHGLMDSTDLRQGLDWIAAAVGAVALAHAVRAPEVRSLVLAGLLAIIALIAVQGAFELLVEHPATIDYYTDNRDLVLRSLGWLPDSIQADNYERRLLQPEASGWFGLANLFSGLMVLGILLLLGFVHRRLPGGSLLLMIMVIVGLAGLVVVNGSKGALAALLLGSFVLVLPFLFTSLRGARTNLPGWCALSCLLVAITAVFVRGFLGEDGLGGERSLLFRSQYLEGALRMVAAHPWFGVGPSGFQEAGLLLKPETAPEDPISAHNMLVDWLASFGLLGLGWIALLGLLTLRTGGFVPQSEDDSDSDRAAMPAGGLAFFTIAILSAGSIGIFHELPALLGNPVSLVTRLIGILLALGCLFIGRTALCRVVGWRRRWALGGLVAALLALGSIDMLFVQVGSLLFVWALLGAASSARPARVRAIDLPVLLVPGCLAVGVLALATSQWQMTVKMDRAADALRTVGQLPSLVRLNRTALDPWTRSDAFDAVSAVVDEAFVDLPQEHPMRSAWQRIELETLAPGSNDPRAIVAELATRLAPVAREQAILVLDELADQAPADDRVRAALVEQLRLLAAESAPRRARSALMQALVRMDGAIERRPSAGDVITSAWVTDAFVELAERPDHRSRVDAFERALEFSPHDPALHLGLANAARDAGDPELEARALSEALRKDALRRLDPLLQWPVGLRLERERRLVALRAELSGTDDPE